ncbi:Kiwa anti-phage protein KwaB-like domain-containing protein [Leptospira sp. GIMC2001]|uniref:Kiwa anti-phage protein KwaB-like domain-containing protein n=1 Tax=Leptospira sp. GIMC2001 TaxID=1513297 RepID=UPI002349D128|nr:hypothetical protein [Leptospira sp. GIMC2001]WCL50706.1 hypothetical protein O4O04_07820 [Leptospira sp. GIMC2001]
MNKNIYQFYAIIDDLGKKEIKHIVLTSQLQIELGNIFDRQIEKFLDVEDTFKYDGRYNTESNESLYINPFDLPLNIKSLRNGQVNVSDLIKSDLIDCKIKSIFGLKIENIGKVVIGFQSLTGNNLIKTNKFNLFFSQNTFIKYDDPGIIINESVVAVFKDNYLFFKSFSLARRVLDLTNYLKSASDIEIDEFIKENPVVLEDKLKFDSNKDEWIRKKIFLIQQDKVLKNFQIKDFKKAAKIIKLNMNTAIVDGKEKIVLPSDKKNLKLTLNLFDDDILDSIVTHKRYISNSKRIYN